MTFTVAGGPTGHASAAPVIVDAQWEPEPASAELSPAVAAAMAVERARDVDAAWRFVEDGEWEGGRDQWGRPLVRTPDGTMRGYRRASSFGSPLESTILLDAWKLRQVARGVTESPALRARVARATVGLSSELEDIVKASKKELDVIAEEAMKLAGSMDKADIGTAIHNICELYDRGLPLGYVDPEWLPDLEEWARLVAQFEVLGVEGIVVNHEFGVAGRYDRVARTRRPFVVRKARKAYKRGNVSRPAQPAIVLPAGTVVIVDLKTSGTMDFASAKFGVQVMTYATGTPYDPLNCCDVEWEHGQPSAEWAAIVHIPSGQGRGSIHWVDLRASYGAAVDAGVCYDWRNRYGKRLIDSPDEDWPLLAAHAGDRAELEYVAELAQRADGCLSEELTVALRARWYELAPAPLEAGA
jgi:hypothetical protein